MHRCEHESNGLVHYSLIHVRIWIMVRLNSHSPGTRPTRYSRQLALVSGTPITLGPPPPDGRFARESGSNRDPAAPYAYIPYRRGERTIRLYTTNSIRSWIELEEEVACSPRSAPDPAAAG